MRVSIPSRLLAVVAAAAFLPAARAQWVTFVNETATRLISDPSLGASDTQEKDYAWADLDQDGDIDLVVVRKQPFTSPGRRSNVLFMNENGVLVDRSATLTGSTVPGSQGFLDETNDRDVVICDVNGDGWLDVVTCTTLTAGQPKYIRVPRVYINLGNDASGNWLGLLYDDPNRIDDAGWGINGEHRFCSVAAGDVDGDGDVDLYFGDYQQGGARSVDIDDRLLINDGTGYFTDQTTQRMTYQMVESSFAMHVDMVDMNADGRLDILKDDALNAPQGISISYNNGPQPGFFGSYQIIYGNAPYHFDIGDLNNDGWPDMIVSDDGQDRYVIHQGVSNGLAQFPVSAQRPFTYSGGGSDDGFAGNNLIVDLDNDGWNDAVIADVDVDIAGCNRRAHIFRNLGNAGPPDPVTGIAGFPTMQEQIVNGQVVGGITPAMLQGTFDIAVFDINGDGWKDMVIGRCTGTQVWINVPPVGINFSYVGGAPTIVAPGAPRQLDINANAFGGISAVAGSARLHYSVNGAPFTTVVMSDIGPGQFRASLPAASCLDRIRYYVSVDGSNNVTYNDPPTGEIGGRVSIAAYGTQTVYENDFEVNANGWTVVNTNLIDGAWERADPIGTINAGQFAAPDDDAQPLPATFAMVTKNGLPGGAAGASDVDGGPTDLISPPMNFAGSDGIISYRRWFYCNLNDDLMTVSVSGDGVNWVTVETLAGAGLNQWLPSSFRIGQYITPTATVRVRFRIADLGTPSITEGGVDVFKAERYVCSVCQQTVPLATVGSATMSMCGGDLSPGTSTTLSVTGMPAFASGLLVFDFLLLPTPWLGGQLISPAPTIIGPLFGDAAGNVAAPLPIGGLLPPGFALYAQTLYPDAAQPFGVGQTNAVRIQW